MAPTIRFTSGHNFRDWDTRTVWICSRARISGYPSAMQRHVPRAGRVSQFPLFAGVSGRYQVGSFWLRFPTGRLTSIRLALLSGQSRRQMGTAVSLPLGNRYECPSFQSSSATRAIAHVTVLTDESGCDKVSLKTVYNLCRADIAQHRMWRIRQEPKLEHQSLPFLIESMTRPKQSAP